MKDSARVKISKSEFHLADTRVFRIGIENYLLKVLTKWTFVDVIITLSKMQASDKNRRKVFTLATVLPYCKVP